MSGNKIAVGYRRPEPQYGGIAVGTTVAAPRVTRVGVVDTQGPPGPVGPAGPVGGYNHTQGSADVEWVINHNLGYYPSVDVFSVGGIELIVEVQHISVNQTRVLHLTPTAGSARLI